MIIKWDYNGFNGSVVVYVGMDIEEMMGEDNLGEFDWMVVVVVGFLLLWRKFCFKVVFFN